MLACWYKQNRGEIWWRFILILYLWQPQEAAILFFYKCSSRNYLYDNTTPLTHAQNSIVRRNANTTVTGIWSYGATLHPSINPVCSRDCRLISHHNGSRWVVSMASEGCSQSEWCVWGSAEGCGGLQLALAIIRPADGGDEQLPLIGFMSSPPACLCCWHLSLCP